MKIYIRGILAYVSYFVFLAYVLFYFGGNWYWYEGWAFIAIIMISIAGATSIIFRDKELLKERLKPPFQKGQDLTDKIILSIFIVGYMAWYFIMPIDVQWYGWSPEFPLWLKIIGCISILAGGALIYAMFKVNTYAAPVVKIQKERKHKVIDTGPYAYVRHPMYTGAALMFIGGPLLLGSLYGLYLGIGLTVIFAIRIFHEEAKLSKELDGYKTYKKKVKWRLIPYLF